MDTQSNTKQIVEILQIRGPNRSLWLPVAESLYGVQRELCLIRKRLVTVISIEDFPALMPLASRY